MESKKKEHLKLEKNSGLYFAVGLTLVLGLIYTALEWKTFDDDLAFNNPYINFPDELDLEIPPKTFITPPPPPVAPPIIEIVPDDFDTIETPVAAVETDYTTEILEPADFVLEEEEEDITVILDLIEEVPIFPGCENASDKKACFQKMMTKHVRRTIRYPDLAQELDIQGRVSTQFIIDKDGNIQNVKMRGPHQVLEKEASRIISKLPKMKPGKQNGKEVKVVFSLPITFTMQ